MGIAVDAIALAHKLDTVILMSGDGDFVPLVHYLKYNSGVQVEVASFGNSTSARLIEVADDFMDLSHEHNRYVLGGRHTGKPNRKKRTAP